MTEISSCKKPEKKKAENLFNGKTDALRLPNDTMEKLQVLRVSKIENFSLALNKSVHFLRHKGKGVEKPTLYKVEKSSRFEIEFSFDTPNPKSGLESLIHRQNNLLEAQEKNGWKVKSNRFAVDNRLIAGLGGASVFETSMTLHHIYGIPYLPGSSIKGLVRSWIIINCFLEGQNGNNKGKEAEKNAMKNPLFAHIFGTDTDGLENKAHRGKVIFFDAYPQSPPVIEADVMNVHYPKYYSQGKAPADYDSPNPIPFLTVGKCDAKEHPLQFSFALATRENPVVTDKLFDAGMEIICKKEGIWREGLSAESSVLDVAHFWLRSALTSHGIGAKTAVGYGYFNATE